jgi:AraC-like DNA-binding protein
VQDWIVERRMSEARRLLAETDLPVAEVARGVGFDDPSYFGRRFRAEHGRGPRAWRRQAMAG